MRSMILTAVVVSLTVVMMSFGPVPDAEARFEQGDLLIDARTSAGYTSEEWSADGESIDFDSASAFGRVRSLFTRNVYLGGTLGYAYDEVASEIELTYLELTGAAGYLFTPSQASSPYIGVNAGLLNIDLESGGDSEDDTNFLWSVEAGFLSHLTERLFFDGSVSYGESDGFDFGGGTEIDAERTQLLLGLGYRF